MHQRSQNLKDIKILTGIIYNFIPTHRFQKVSVLTALIGISNSQPLSAIFWLLFREFLLSCTFLSDEDSLPIWESLLMLCAPCPMVSTLYSSLRVETFYATAPAGVLKSCFSLYEASQSIGLNCRQSPAKVSGLTYFLEKNNALPMLKTEFLDFLSSYSLEIAYDPFQLFNRQKNVNHLTGRRWQENLEAKRRPFCIFH